MAYGWSAVFADRRKTFSNSDLESLTEQVFAIFDQRQRNRALLEIEWKVFVDQIPGARTRIVFAFIGDRVTERGVI